MSGVLGIATIAYLPFCFFNLLSPVLDIAYGFLGFKVPTTSGPWVDAQTAEPPLSAADGAQPALTSSPAAPGTSADEPPRPVRTSEGGRHD